MKSDARKSALIKRMAASACSTAARICSLHFAPGVIPIEPALRIYDKFGIALEAHQQNSLIAFDDAHLPVRFYYRDIQGLALSESFRAELTRLVPELERQEKVFEPDDIVRATTSFPIISTR